MYPEFYLFFYKYNNSRKYLNYVKIYQNILHGRIINLGKPDFFVKYYNIYNHLQYLGLKFITLINHPKTYLLLILKTSYFNLNNSSLQGIYLIYFSIRRPI